MRITESKLRRIIRNILLEANGPKTGIESAKRFQGAGEASEKSWEKMYKKPKKGLNLRGAFPELRKIFSNAKNIEEPNNEQKKKIFSQLGLNKGAFDDLANSEKSELQKARSLYDSRKVQNPKSLTDIIKNYSMLIALFRKCDLNYLLETNKDQADKVKIKNYIFETKNIQVVNENSANNLKASFQGKSSSRNVFCDDKGSLFSVINLVKIDRTYAYYTITRINFKSSDVKKSFAEFLNKHGYEKKNSSYIIKLKNKNIKKQ